MGRSFLFRCLADHTDWCATLGASPLSLLRMSRMCLRRSSLLVSCHPVGALHCSSDNVLFRGLGRPLPRLQFLHQRDRIILIACSTTVDVYTTMLYLESYQPLVSFTVVAFRIMDSIQLPPCRSFVNFRFSIYHSGHGQFNSPKGLIDCNALPINIPHRN